MVVLAVARQEPQKDLGTLVRAFARVRAVEAASHLYIAGRQGSATSELGREIAELELGSSVTLLGERADVGDLLCAADVFVLSSRREGMPGSVIEAMALETPVIASDLPQVREIVSDECAMLVRPGDVDGFTKAILECGDDLRAQRRQRVACGLREVSSGRSPSPGRLTTCSSSTIDVLDDSRDANAVVTGRSERGPAPFPRFQPRRPSSCDAPSPACASRRRTTFWWANALPNRVHRYAASVAAAPARIIANYLPQFHPIPENDEWWGPGFTEWTNVARARRLFRVTASRHPGRPRLLRPPTARDAVASNRRISARDYGVTCVRLLALWVWRGRRVLERPSAESASGEPDFPFCVGGPTQSWTGRLARRLPSHPQTSMTYPGPTDDRRSFPSCGAGALTTPGTSSRGQAAL